MKLNFAYDIADAYLCAAQPWSRGRQRTGASFGFHAFWFIHLDCVQLDLALYLIPARPHVGIIRPARSQQGIVRHVGNEPSSFAHTADAGFQPALTRGDEEILDAVTERVLVFDDYNLVLGSGH